MIKALAVKELRELLGIAGLGLAVCLVVVAMLCGVKPFATWAPLNQIGTPFQERVFPPFIVVSGLFAVVLGLRQSAWEEWRGTYQFLLHRPVRRETIFLTKLATGGGVYLACTGTPLLLYALWATTLGRRAAPFEWAMTGFAWRLWFTMPLIYLGAFLTGLRPARWYGTRLLPLVACATTVAGLMVLPWWWQVGLPATIVLYALLTANICAVARERDYA
jgi:hypothetical protein